MRRLNWQVPFQLQKGRFNYVLLQQMRRFDSAFDPYRMGVCFIRVSARLQLSKAQQLEALPAV